VRPRWPYDMRPSVRAEKYIRDASGWRKDVTDGNDNGTDRRTDRVRRNMRPPPREEGRIITRKNLIQRKETVSPFTQISTVVSDNKEHGSSDVFNMWSTFLSLQRSRCFWHMDWNLRKILRIPCKNSQNSCKEFAELQEFAQFWMVRSVLLMLYGTHHSDKISIELVCQFAL